MLKGQVLVTGADGFIGGNLTPVLEASGWDVRRLVRRGDDAAGTIVVRGIGKTEDFSRALEGMSAVVHLAARVHVLRESDEAPMERFREVNVLATQRLAEQAAASGVKRFVFLSTIGVHGVNTNRRKGFSEDDAMNPSNEYARSKVEAECALRAVAEKTGLEVVILRPPLVYGPGVKANFLKLLWLVEKGWPLPLASVENKRDLVYVGNLADVVLRSLENPAAAGQTFVVADGEPVSTPDLFRRIAKEIKRPTRLFPCPERLLNLAGTWMGKSEILHRLTGSLEVDISKLRQALDWTPPFTFSEGVKATVEWYLEDDRKPDNRMTGQETFCSSGYPVSDHQA